MQGNRQFHGSQRTRQMSARFGNGIDHKESKLVSQLRQTGRFQLTQVCWRFNRV
ncbi:hypothetical protein EVA_10723 [gut metagenome]|uniref:Uncharacterized protein n=1 Tax=gut metagenome TaxID=749906 RepID=J9GMU2_9ZZZZ